MKRLAAILIILLFALPAWAGHRHLEREYQEKWCAACGGTTEVRLLDMARVDCVTDGYAVEFDFGSKWAESAGQALYYAEKTGLKPGIVLILERPSDSRYLDRLNVLARKHGITVWTMTPEDLEK
jgi:hypothetical protein